ncbi:hypothetical protein GCM10028822_33210 [Hymenobacter terrigena]
MGLLLFSTGLFAPGAWAQTPTPGLIFKPATAGTPGSAVLDPDNDGYVSSSGKGFTVADGDVGNESEIPYRYLPQAVTNEPNADLRVGPSNKFTDFADVPGGGGSVGFFVDAKGNYMFRFRLGGAAPNSKGYSIAIDTDNKFGFSGPEADPNAVAGNPGFEMEILLASNFGVRLYNLDGTASPTGPGPDNSLLELPYASYAQKSVAVTRNNGDLDVFYDFYIPLATIQNAFGPRTFFNGGGTAAQFSLSTPLRMVANTIIAPHSVTHYQNISDISGVNDASYPTADLAFIQLIGGATPTSGTGVPNTPGTSLPARTAPPVVKSPLLQGATAVSGTSTEAGGTAITVYVNGNALGTTATVQADGTWTLTGVPALATGDLVKATAKAPSKSASAFSSDVRVGNTPACATAAPAVTCSSDRGVYGTAAPGATVYLRYPNGDLVPFGGNKQVTTNPVTANSSGNFYFTTGGGNLTDCNNGQSNSLLGTYLVTQVASGTSCESSATTVCVGAVTAAATPVVTTARPITPSTTSLVGTATSGAIVTLFVDGSRFGSVTATGGNFTFSGTALPTLTAGRVLTLNATMNGASCASGNVTLNVVVPRTVTPPVVNAPLSTGATSVTGTSVEAPGSTITLTTYLTTDGTGTATATYTTTVQANGTWTVTVPARAVNTSVKATVTPVDYGTSGFSNVVPVLDRTTSAPVISGSYNEKDTSVSGTSGAAVGSVITVYIDGGFPIGTTTVQAGGTWTLTGLSDGSGTGSNTVYPTLYAGGLLTATATETNKLPSALSTAVQVGCATLASKTISAAPICVNNVATFTVPNVEPGIVYSLQNAATGSDLPTGLSRLATGTGTSSLALVTEVFGTDGTFPIKLNAFSIGAVNCSTTSPAFSLTVNPLPLARTVSAQNANIATYQAARPGTNIIVQSSQTGVSYQLVNISATPNANVGAPQNGTNGNLNLPTGPVPTQATSTTYAVVATTTPGCSQRVGTQTITYSGPLPVVLTAFEAQAVGNDVQLTWRTAQEENNDHFEVERSADGQRFATVALVAGEGTRNQPQSYQTTDAQSSRFGQQLYYRLRQVDIDGTQSFSPVRSVRFAADAAATAVLTPNPTSQDARLDLLALPAGQYTVSVLAATGQTLLTQQLAAGQVHTLPVAALPAGIYLVRITGPAFQKAVRLVKE